MVIIKLIKDVSLFLLIKKFVTMKLPLFWIKLTNFEYWTWYIFYLPLLPYFAYLAIKHRSLTIFTAANPAIFLGGLFGESKNEIFELIR